MESLEFFVGGVTNTKYLLAKAKKGSFKKKTVYYIKNSVYIKKM